jgi:hypothetical protein
MYLGGEGEGARLTDYIHIYNPSSKLAFGSALPASEGREGEDEKCRLDTYRGGLGTQCKPGLMGGGTSYNI